MEVHNWVIVGGRLGVIHKVGKRGNAKGAWVISPTNDPGTSGGYPSFAPEWCITAAVVGSTVCAQPRFSCYCGLTHVTESELKALPRKETPNG